LVLVLAIILAALPQSSMAATALGATNATCKTTYTVKSGDYLTKIANANDVDWRDLADANDLKSPYVVYVGQKLCIPSGSSSGSSGTTSSTSTTAKIAVTKSKDTITISSSKLPTNNTYFVRVDNANNKKLEWYRVGVLKTGKQASVKESFKLPDSLKNATSLNVCLKNISSDAVVCNNPNLDRGATKSSSGSSSSAKWQGTYTADLVSDEIEISTSNFPKSSIFYVKVDGTGSWTKIGVLKIKSDTSVTESFTLPSKLAKAKTVAVCLKNVENDTVSCLTAFR
jgi:LysM repeat protein